MTDEEGVVAIVQGLKDAGLAVTVLNRRLLRSRRSDNSHRRPSASKSSVETNTDKSYSDYCSINKATSVRDGHYASSYQIAHCNARPTSPTPSLPGFPPQRCKPSRTEGNFEIGFNHGVWDTLTTTPRSCRGGMRYSERSINSGRGSMYMNRSERLVHETFAHSLRRYPTHSPERSISADLVQKLLSYTQNKYLTKSPSKSQRSLNREKSPQTTKFDVKPTKNIQTYTRKKREVSTRDCGANTSHDLKFMTKKRRSYGAFNNNRYKDENNNTSFNYLNSPTSPTTSYHSARRTSEVRYLRDVKKYIHDTIRQIYDDNPVVCPKIRSRYSHHRRQHHKGHDQNSSQSIEVQASVPTTSKTTTFTHCVPPLGSHCHIPHYASATTSDIMCCNCNKPRPCICEQKAAKAAAAVQQQIAGWVDDLSIYAENTRPNKREKEQIIKELIDAISNVPKDENYDENVKEAIKTYIESLPIWDLTDDNGEAYKDEVVDNLVDRLHTVEDKTVAAVKDVVRKWLHDLQFYKNIDMNNTANIFAAHLTPLLSDISELKIKTKELLESLPITNEEAVIKDIRNGLLNDLIELSDRSDLPVLKEEELENEINEFLQNYPDILNQLDKVKNLVRMLKNTQSRPISQREKEKKMKDNVVDWIDTLPKGIRDKFTPKEKEEFSNDLVDRVLDTAKNAMEKDRKSSLESLNEIENEIWGLLESMDVDQNDVDESMVKNYALNLKEAKSAHFDKDDVANKTNDFLNKLDKSGILMRGKEQDKFQEKVLSKLKGIQAKNRQSGGGKQSSFVTSTPKKGKAPSYGRDFNVSSIDEGDESSYSMAGPSGLKNAKKHNNELNDQIKSWVETLPINLDHEKKHKNVIINDLANDIIDRHKYLQTHPNAAKSDADELEHLKYQVFRWLNKMDGVKDHEMAPVMDKTKELMDRIINIDLLRFIKSSSRSPTRDEGFGSPAKVKKFESPAKEKRSGSPTREKNFGDKSSWLSSKEKSLGSPNRKKNLGSPTREKKLDSPTRERSTSSPTKENSFESTNKEKNLGAPTREKSIGSPTRGKNLGSPTREKNISSPIKENSFGSATKEKSFGSPTRDQNLGSPSGQQSFGNKTYIPTQDASMFIRENLDGAISDFTKQLPLYERANPEQKRKFEEVVPEISKAIKRIYDGIDNLEQDIDKLVTDEIVRQMKGFPINSEDKNDSKFMNQAAAQLLQYLKDQQMFQDISERKDVPYDQYLKQYVDDWVESLSIIHLSPPREKEFEDLKDEFTLKLKQAREDRFDEDKIRSMIIQYLKVMPLKDEVRNKEYLDRKIEELLKALSTLPVAIASRIMPSIHNLARQAIAKWMQTLPLDTGKNVTDIPKGAVENIENKVSDALTLTDEIPKARKSIEGATIRFLDEVPLDPEKIHDKKALADDLFGRVRDIPKSIMKENPNSYGERSGKGQASNGSNTAGSALSRKPEDSSNDKPVTSNELKAIGENLSGAILDWMKQQPDYVSKKAELDKLVPELSKTIKSIILQQSKREDRDKMLVETLTKQFQNTPLESKGSESAAQLVQYLKDLQMLQELPGTSMETSIEELVNIVNSFIKNNLKLKKGTWSDKIKFGKIKSELVMKLKEMIDNKADRDALKNEIKYHLSKFPISEKERKDDRFLEKKAEELIKSLPMNNKNNFPEVYSFVRKGFVKWMKNLPLEKGKNVNDIPKEAIDQITRRLSNQLIHTDTISINETKKMIQKETDKFLQKTPLDRNKSYDSKKMAKDIFDCIKESSTAPNKASSKDKAEVSEPLSTGVFVFEPTSSSQDMTTEISIPKPSSEDKTADTSLLTSSSKDKSQDITTDKSISKPPSKDKTADTSLLTSSSKDKSQDITTEKSISKPPSKDKTADTSLLTSSSKDKSQDITTEKSISKPPSKDKTADTSLLTSSSKDKSQDITTEISIPKPSSRDKTADTSLLKVLPKNKSQDITTERSIPKPSSKDKTADASLLTSLPKDKSQDITTEISIPKPSSKDKTADTSLLKILPKYKSQDVTTERSIPKPSCKDKSQDVTTERSIPKPSSKDKSQDVTTERSIPKPSSKDKSQDVTTERSIPKPSSKDKSQDVTTERSIPKPSSKDKTADTSLLTSSSKDETTKVSKVTSTETLLSNKSGSMHPSFKSAAEQLAENVEQWVNNLRMKEDNLEEKNKASNMRRYLSSRIVSKVSELNTNPEIFNDDFLYGEMFEDELDDMITALSSEDLKREMRAHKKALIDIVKYARLKTQEEMAGTVYKQLLREVVSKNVPSESLNENENASFEVLKEEVADAFVSLHYIRGKRGDTDSKTQFKNNVKGEIDIFCADYLKSHPKTAVNTDKLNDDLYKALKDVPVPKDETIRHEIEIIKIKEVINQWIDEGKLFGKQTGVNRLKTKKKISVLAKKIHDIENLKENNSDFDSDNMLNKEIQKWLQKMPLVVKDDLNKLAERLIKKLKETEDWRKSLESDSSAKDSILPTSSYSNETRSSPLDSTSIPGGSSTLPPSSFSNGAESSPIDTTSTSKGSSGAKVSRTPKPTVSSTKVLRRSVISPSKASSTDPEVPVTPVADVSTVPEVTKPTRTDTSTAPQFTIVPSPCAPPCAIPVSTLSPEDREYLIKIRERATQSMPQSSPKPSKDAAVSPIPVDYGSQTEITADVTNTTPQAQSTPRQAQTSCCQTSESVETCKPRMQAAGSQVEVVPHVIVKEYYWDSVDPKMSRCSRIITCPPATCPQIPEVTCPQRRCPTRTSQHAQTPTLNPEELDVDCQESPCFLPDLTTPCTAKQKSSYNVEPKIQGCNKNLAWSKEELYGERRDPSDEEEIVIDTGRKRKLSCRCKDR